MDAFATNCCLYSVLDKSFDFGDANTVSNIFICLYECHDSTWYVLKSLSLGMIKESSCLDVNLNK